MMVHSKNKGFTLIELVIVVAIIALLVSISVPVVNRQLEKSRNVADMQTAKTIASVMISYFITNPDALAELTAQCDSNSLHYVQVSVAEGNAAISSVLRPALYEAGLIDSYNTNPAARFKITCKSRTEWIGYRVVVSNYSGVQGKPGDLAIYYWGVPAGGNVHSTNSLKAYQSGADSTSFHDAMSGAS